MPTTQAKGEEVGDDLLIIYGRKEINRKLTDHCSTLLFSPTLNAAINLVNEGIPPERIFITGDTMVDACYQHLIKTKDSTILERLKLDTKDFLIITLHRQENVDNEDNLKSIIEALIELSEYKIVFPIHHEHGDLDPG